MSDGARTGPVGIGVIGAGNISSQYLRNLTAFPDTRVLAVGDAIPDVARARAAEYGVPVAGDASVVVGHPDVEIVVNLTIPAAHAEIAELAIGAGKHVWNEKPLAADRAAARRLLGAADRAGVRVGGAPDTFLGVGLQAVRRLVDEGAIGRPLTALALMQSPGPDSWHPNPAFLFQDGAGPLFDIGPYSLTTLVQVFGPVESVAAAGSTAHPRRMVGSGPRAGETFEVTTPSHVGALIRFESGGSAQAIFSFDSPQWRALVEITGAEGMIVVPDPNEFDGKIRVRRLGARRARTATTTVARFSRGIGVLDMARAIREGRPHRATGELAYHVLDVMSAIAESTRGGAFARVESRVAPAEPLPPDWDPYARTLTG